MTDEQPIVTQDKSYVRADHMTTKELVLAFLKATVNFEKGGPHEYSFVITGSVADGHRKIQSMRMMLSRTRNYARANKRPFSAFKTYTVDVEDLHNGTVRVTVARGHSRATSMHDTIDALIMQLGSINPIS